MFVCIPLVRPCRGKLMPVVLCVRRCQRILLIVKDWSFHAIGHSMPLVIPYAIGHSICHWSFHMPLVIPYAIGHSICYWSFHMPLAIPYAIGHSMPLVIPCQMLHPQTNYPPYMAHALCACRSTEDSNSCRTTNQGGSEEEEDKEREGTREEPAPSSPKKSSVVFDMSWRTRRVGQCVSNWAPDHATLAAAFMPWLESSKGPKIQPSCTASIPV